MKNKNYLKSSPLGACLSVIASFCALAFAGAYCLFFNGTAEFSLYATGLFLASGLLGVVGIFLGLQTLLKYGEFLLNLAGLMYFIYAVYYYVSVVMTGIDLDSFSFEFLLCSGLACVAFMVSVVNLFVKHDNDNNEEKEHGGRV